MENNYFINFLILWRVIVVVRATPPIHLLVICFCELILVDFSYYYYYYYYFMCFHVLVLNISRAPSSKRIMNWKKKQHTKQRATSLHGTKKKEDILMNKKILNDFSILVRRVLFLMLMFYTYICLGLLIRKNTSMYFIYLCETEVESKKKNYNVGIWKRI